MFAVLSLYDVSDMFCLCTLPWYCKAFILAYDGFKCWQQQRAPQDAGSALDVHAMTLWIFAMQAVSGLVLLGPSLILSVSDRFSTNVFVSEMLLLLSSYMLLIGAMRLDFVSAEHACFCLQFCSCYFFYCYLSAVSRNKKLLLARSVVQWCCVLGMLVFPIMYSHLPRDCMHLSPHVLLFLFTGELSACLCMCVSHAINGIESVVDMLYGRIVDML
jgi:hypothetical protein